MSDLPEIVHDRLQAAVPREAHPDADVLTAFAEQGLSITEREGVVGHLAGCAECRETVALSLPPLEAVAPAEAAGEETTRQPVYRAQAWFGWPRLRWAALAASVVVVGSVLLLRPGRQPDLAIENQKSTSTGAEQVPALTAKANSPATPAPQATQSYAMPAANKADGVLASDRPASVRDEQLPRGLNTRAAVAPVPFADSKPMGSVNGGLFNSPAAAAAPAIPSGSAADRAPVSTNETVEVTGAQPQINTESATLGELTTSKQVLEPSGSRGAAQSQSPPPPMNGRNFAELSIVKAKPAAAQTAQANPPAKEKKEELQTESTVQNREANLPPGYSNTAAFGLQKSQLKRSKDAVPQWSLAQGKLQRSLDAGATWQIALQLEHQLLSFGARGSDVWAGGQSGTLFHSTDSGATWAMVQPSTSGGVLTADIVAVEIGGPSEVHLSTSNHESWTTTDGGKTWDRK